MRITPTPLRLLFRHDETVAADSLGPRHPLVRALASRRARARQLLVTLAVIVLGLVGTLEHTGRAKAVLGAAAIVAILFALGLVFACARTSEEARELIADGGGGQSVPVVTRERMRLTSRKERERLARSLEGYQRDASEWTRIDPRVRPPAEICCLRYADREARDVTRLVRSDSPSPRGVAALSRFLTDGRRSSLFSGDVSRLRFELLRIASLLDPDADALPEAA